MAAVAVMGGKARDYLGGEYSESHERQRVLCRALHANGHCRPYWEQCQYPERRKETLAPLAVRFFFSDFFRLDRLYHA